MAQTTRPAPPARRRYVPHPLPEPPRHRHVARIARPALDRIGKLLEQWLAELRGSYTVAGD